MRSRLRLKTRFNFNTILFFLFIVLTINAFYCEIITASPGEILEIIAPDEVYEEELFTVSVMDQEIIEDSPWIIDVIIEFNGYLYQINETAELEIQAPQVNQDKNYLIKASKEG